MFEPINKLNKAQKEAATQIEGPLLILAGAGTGKTFTMVCRAGYMIDSGVLPENILMLTFTNKAAKEMKGRLASYLNEEQASKVVASTFHSFCVSLLRRYGVVIGLNPNFTVLSSTDDEEVIAIVKSSAPREKFSGKGFPPNSKIAGYISSAINKNSSISEVMRGSKYEDFTDAVIEIGKLSALYKAKNNMVNYDDLLLRVIDLLDEHPNITHDIAMAHPYIMVDEYQDTNPLQDIILRRLFKYTKNIAVVGDDMQSLYAFRGAEVDNIISFPKRFNGCKIIKLEENYRSSQQILDVANIVTTCATEGFPKTLIATRPNSQKPTAVSVADQHTEATYALGLISKWLKDGVSPSEICVIERNSILSAELEILLSKNNIAFDKYGGLKFVDLSYVRDILAYLKLMLNPKDEISMFRVLKVHYGIGNIYARRIAESVKENGIDDLVSKQHKKKSYYKELESLYNQFQKCEGMSLTDMVSSFINFYIDTDKSNIERMDTSEGNRTERLEKNKEIKNELHKLVEIAEKYKKIDELLDDLLLDNSGVDDKNPNGKIVISTVHSVKGLEFDNVIVLDCVDGIFPNADVEGSKEDNEELRCFYVSVTRARNNLVMMCPKSAMRYGRTIAGNPSRYLKESEGTIISNDINFFKRFEKHEDDDYYTPWRRRNIWD